MAAKSALQEETRQTRPFRTPHQEAALGILRTADLLRHHFAEVLEPHGLTLQQFNVLRILRGALPDPLPTMEIAERMIEKTPGITRLVDRLAAKGLVARERSADDRRCVHCSITPAGRRLLAALDAPVEKADDEALAALDADQARRLIELLDAVRAHHG